MATAEEKKIITPPEGYTLTENGALCYANVGNAGLELFFKMVRGLTNENYHQLLEEAWSESQDATLRIIFHARDCRGGKGEKELFYAGIAWLWEKSPQTVLANLEHVPFFGTWKDLIQLAVRVPALESHVIDLFSSQLHKDKQILDEIKASGKKQDISLCAKWAPSENHKFDNAIHLSQKIADRLTEKSPQSLKLYRTQYLVPLREHLRVTERYMCKTEWQNIPYSSVASRCMHLNKKAFQKHDARGFGAFLAAVAEGKSKITGKQLYPHELVRAYLRNRSIDQVAELQWKVILDELRESGTLEKAIVLSDVSGSMSGVPMEVSIALGLLISELTPPPFKDLVLTFESQPVLHKVTGDSLFARVGNLEAAPWGGSTDFRKALELVLKHAKEHSLAPADMPKMLFVISDMQFNQADNSFGVTEHEHMTSLFRKDGYDLPTIVYWNVRANTPGFPAPPGPGVVLLSGYSPSLLKLVLAADLEAPGDLSEPETEKPNGLEILQIALANERYNILKV